jgi:hypothetical protein
MGVLQSQILLFVFRFMFVNMMKGMTMLLLAVAVVAAVVAVAAVAPIASTTHASLMKLYGESSIRRI